MNTLYGHTKTITSIQYIKYRYHDWLLSTSHDGTAKIWSANNESYSSIGSTGSNARLVGNLEAHPHQIMYGAAVPIPNLSEEANKHHLQDRGWWIATVNFDRTFKLWKIGDHLTLN